MPPRKPVRTAERRPMGAEAEERWNEIVDAAGSIFYKKGYEATSLQDIASAVGLLKGSVYYYIRTKEDILFELVMRALDQFEKTAEEDDVTAKAPAPERLQAFIGRWMGMTARSREWNLVAEREFQRLSQPNLRTIIERRDKLSAFLKGIIQAGIDEGAFDPSTDLSVAAAAIFELMRSSHLWHRPGGRLSWQDVGNWYATFAIRGLGGPQWEADSAAVAGAGPAARR